MSIIRQLCLSAAASALALAVVPRAQAKSCPSYADFFEVRASSTSCSVVKRIQKKLYSRGFDLAERPLVQVDREAWRCRFSGSSVTRAHCRNLEGKGSWQSKFSVG